MADSTLTALAAAAALAAADLVYCSQGGASVKLTAAQIKTFVSASPTLVTPALGTPASGTLTNCTGYPLAALGSGTLDNTTFLRGDGTFAVPPGTGGGGATLGANTFTALQTITQASANAGILASTGYSLTGSNASNMLDFAGTWNTSGTPTAIKVAITNTASNASSLLMNLLAGASGTTSIFNVTVAGNVTAAGSITSSSGNLASTNGTVTAGSGSFFVINSRSKIGSSVNGTFTFQNNGATNSFSLSFPTATATPTIQFGALDAAAPVAQTLQTQSVVAGTSNTAGVNTTFKASAGTGTGVGGIFDFQTADAGSSGTTQNTWTSAFKVDRGVGVYRNFTVATLPSASGVGAGATSFVSDGSTTLILGLGLPVVGGGANKVPVYSDGTNWIVG